MTDKMREEFEAWAITSAWLGLSTGCMEIHDDDYVGCELQAAWLSWQASRASLVVELPKPCAAPLSYTDILVYGEVVKAIESAGIKIKE